VAGHVLPWVCLLRDGGELRVGKLEATAAFHAPQMGCVDPVDLVTTRSGRPQRALMPK
jgi:hypothetical protein